MRHVINNIHLNIEDRGSVEPALIFLHYWGGTSRTWDGVINQLKDHFRCIAYDMRGWGASDKPMAGYALADLADEAAAVISALGVKEFVLVGHSLGGKISQLLASRNPVGLKGLLLVAPAPPTPLRFPEEMKQTQIHAYDNRQNVLQTIRFLSALPSSSPLVEQIVEDSMSGSREATLAYPTASILEDISEDVSHIAVTTLVVAGELDQLDSLEQHKREVIARIPGSVLTVIEGSGHLVPIDQPALLADRILHFVSALPG